MSELVSLSEGGAVCINIARTDLCGGCRVTDIPTATPDKKKDIIMKKVFGLVLFSVWIFSSLISVEPDECNPKILSVAQHLRNLDVEDICIEKLKGGLTNDNYKVRIGSRSYFFRLSFGLDAILGNSLEREWQITTLVSKAFIAPEVIFYSRVDGVLVTEFIESNLEKIDLHNPQVMQKMAKSLSFLHSLKVNFPTDYDPFTNIEEYVVKAGELGVELPFEFSDSVIPQIKSYQNDVTADFVKVPAHLDLHAGNLLKQGAKYWLIDWEYAAMADPFFDLATLASAENYSDLEMIVFLEYYLERKSTTLENKYFYKMRILADIRWALWSYIQAKVSPVDEGFHEMGNIFFEKSLKRIITSY